MVFFDGACAYAEVVASQIRGTPTWTPKQYNSHYMDPQKGTVSLIAGNSHVDVLGQ